LGADDLDPIIAVGKLVIKGIQDVAEIGHQERSFRRAFYCGMMEGEAKGLGWCGPIEVMSAETASETPSTISRRAVVLLSGGLDSATTAAIARDQGYELFALSIDYGQRHRFELEAAARVVRAIGVAKHVTVTVGLDQFGGSALTDAIAVPQNRSDEEM